MRAVASQRRRGRPSASRTGRGTLSRELILHRAIQLAEAEGVEALTMRRLGQELGVQAMSLYNHVANKADLLDGITGTLLANMALPEVAAMRWDDRVRASAHAFRGLAHEYPNLFPLVFERPMTAPESLLPLERALANLRRVGFIPEQAVSAMHIVLAYVGGFALVDISEFGLGRPRVPMASYDGLADDELAAYPHVVEMLPAFTSYRRDEAFAFGLEALIDGLRASLPQSGRDGQQAGEAEVRTS